MAAPPDLAPPERAPLYATAQAHLVASGQVLALHLVDAAIARIEALNLEVNVVIDESFERLQLRPPRHRCPAGPFGGVPLVLNDLDGVSAGRGTRASQERRVCETCGRRRTQQLFDRQVKNRRVRDRAETGL